jgi:hypothetical protein
LSGSNKTIWFHRARGIAWGLFGALSFVMGWQNNVALVWGASVYANAMTDWGAGEAADDRDLKERLERLERNQEEILRLLRQ